MSDTENKRLLLNKVHLKGFKSIKDLKLELKPGLNILIGKNGSGKSNLLEFLNDSVSSIYPRRGINFKYVDILFTSSIGKTFEYEIEHKQNMSADNMILPEDLYEQKLYLNKELIFNNTDENFVDSITYNKESFKVRHLYQIFARLGYGLMFPTFIRYDLPKEMIGINIPGLIKINLEDKFGYKEFTGGGLLSQALNDAYSAFVSSFYEDVNYLSSEGEPKDYLDHLAKYDVPYLLNHTKLDQNIIDNLSIFTPIKNLRINENINFSKNGNEILFENIRLDFYVNDQWLPWSQLSDGTKRLFYIITELTQHSNGVILLEEPELGIHPHQFHLLMQFIKAQAEEKQIVISTHSPKALDILNVDELDAIMIATYDKEKGTQINRMNSDQQSVAKEYMKEMFLSDYWLLSDLEGDD